MKDGLYQDKEKAVRQAKMSNWVFEITIAVLAFGYWLRFVNP